MGLRKDSVLLELRKDGKPNTICPLAFLLKGGDRIYNYNTTILSVGPTERGVTIYPTNTTLF